LTRWAAEGWHARALHDLDARRQHGDRGWPSIVYVPATIAEQIVADASAEHGQSGPLDVPDAARALQCFAGWRLTKGLFHFSRAAIDRASRMPWRPELFLRLPHWCVYVAVPAEVELMASGERRVRGAFAWLDAEDAVAFTVRFGIDTGGDVLEALDVTLDPGLSGAGVTARLADEVDATTGAGRVSARTSLLVSLVAMLGEEYADIRPRHRGPGLDHRPANPAPVRTRAGWQIPPARHVTQWSVR
jgi:hypothetical protein